MKNYEFCILKDDKDLIDYEKGLYKAFTKITRSVWRENNYKLIDGCRYKCNVPYEDQILYAIKKKNKIVMAFSVKINCKGKMLIEELGFNLPEKDKTKKICEGLDFFSFIKFRFEFFDLYSSFFKFVLNDLKKRGFKTLYGSCEEKIKSLYGRIGFKFVDKIELNGKKEYLLKIEID